MKHIRNLSDDEFKSDVLEADRPVLVDFWAAWCGPCRQLAPELEKIAERYGDRLEVAKMDVDANPLTPPKYNVMSIPTMVLFVPNQRPRPLIGYMSAEVIAERLRLEEI